ncbi:MAG: hypothetical protein HZA91_20745 [Verrucomicrobia bacterium]|nr:hypothetical protein [Verrucomicrobiota bacterium]
MTAAAVTRTSSARLPSGRAAIRLHLASGRRVVIALTPAELWLQLESGESFHYDLKGRLQKVIGPQRIRQRSLSHQVLTAQPSDPGAARLAPTRDAADALVAEAEEHVALIAHELQARWADIEAAKPSKPRSLELIGPLLGRAANFDVPAARRDAERLHALYGHTPSLPSDQHDALALYATEGCCAECTFCDARRRGPNRLRTGDQFRQHVHDAVAYHGESLRARRSIFLGEASALSVPLAELRNILGVLREQFVFPPSRAARVPPRWWLGHADRFDGVAGFMDPTVAQQRTAAQFAGLRTLGLRRAYIGMETGDGELMRWLRKPGNPDAIRHCVKTLKSARLSVGLTVLLGAGGVKFAAAHERETARLLNDLPLDRDDTVFFSPLDIDADGGYAMHTMAAGIECLTDAQMREQERAIRAALRFGGRRGSPALAHYDVEALVY